MPQLAQGRELGEAKKPEGVATLRLAFQVLITSARGKRLPRRTPWMRQKSPPRDLIASLGNGAEE
jgi:hypothetical protein